jgi:hypothetical protein
VEGLGLVWDCGSDSVSGSGSKGFSLRNASKWNFFHFLKIIFDISTSKRSENIKKKFILSKKKNSNFLGTQCEHALR